MKNKILSVCLSLSALVGCDQSDKIVAKNHDETPISSGAQSMEDTASAEALRAMRDQSKKWSIPIFTHNPDRIYLESDPSYPKPQVLAKASSEDYAILWENTGYTGRSLRINPNEDYNDLRYTNNGSYNDIISSVQIFGNATIYLYRDINFTGGGIVVSSSTSDLTPLFGFNDYTSSLVWANHPPKAPDYGIEFCKNQNLSGGCIPIQFPLDLNMMPSGWNDIISSASLINGLTNTGTLYANSNWTGASFSITGSHPFVGSSFNDQASSFKWDNQ